MSFSGIRDPPTGRLDPFLVFDGDVVIRVFYTLLAVIFVGTPFPVPFFPR